MLARMTQTFSQERPRIVLIRASLDELRRANGIASEAKLAEVLGVSPSTLWRITNEKVAPSEEFIARALTAFPHAGFAKLFRVEQPTTKVEAA
jgi:transcriptional regulator with XRE-family HTH domain